ncbi:MAG: hypothetical protein QGG36_25735 [Pirellulaceae bacterium]|jgi:hypothetical protein|nr:hypothetical protein [Pirellulaceae bacterium]MDP7019225.1 hypothetical protein [Pirellulaceae bacterium]
MELREALTQISHIREQIDRTAIFRGYRSTAVGFSGLVAFVAAALQPLVVVKPAENIGGYLALWIGVAGLSAGVSAAEMFLRTRHSDLERQKTWTAIEHFLPSLAAGALLTAALACGSESSCWSLPGLWAIVFSLGVFASLRLLPRAVTVVAGWYLLGGTLYLLLGESHGWAYSPWSMAVLFGCGQLITAVILYQTLERGHGK